MVEQNQNSETSQSQNPGPKPNLPTSQPNSSFGSGMKVIQPISTDLKPEPTTAQSHTRFSTDPSQTPQLQSSNSTGPEPANPQLPKPDISSIYPTASDGYVEDTTNKNESKVTAFAKYSDAILKACCIVMALPLIISFFGHHAPYWLSYFTPNPIGYLAVFGASTGLIPFIKIGSILILALVAGIFLKKETTRTLYIYLAIFTFIVSISVVIKDISEIQKLESIQNSGVNFSGVNAKFYETLIYSYILGLVLPMTILTRKSIRDLFS